MTNELIIRIAESSDEPGYFYDVYDTADITDDDAQSIDGGLCETTIDNALEMAYDCAKKILATRKEEAILGRISDMKKGDADTGEHPDATGQDYRKWAEEEVIENGY